MIPKEKLPTSNFTIDEVEAQGFDRNEVIATCKRLTAMHEGRFISGRHGFPSRFEWAKMTIPANQSTPAPLESKATAKTDEDFLAFLQKVKSEKEGEKQKVSPEPVPEPVITYVDSGKKKERDPFLVIRDEREGTAQAKQLQSLTVVNVLQTIATIMGFKGAVSYDALMDFLDKQHQELLKLREGVKWEEPPGIEELHVPYELISEKTLPNGATQTGWLFWNPEQREAIAKELRAYRRGK